MRWVFWTGFFLVLSLPFWGCSDIPMAPEDPVRLKPRAIHRVWFQEVEACMGLDGYFDVLRIYISPNLGAPEITGRFVPPSRIYLVSSTQEDEDFERITFKHEVQHYLLYRTGDSDPKHLRPEWYGEGACDESS